MGAQLSWESICLTSRGSQVRALLFPPYGPVVQLVRTLACHARGRGFEPHPGRHFLPLQLSRQSRGLKIPVSLVRFRPEAPRNAGLAHLVERHLAKVEVASSSLVIRSISRQGNILIVKKVRNFCFGFFYYPLVFECEKERRSMCFCVLFVL